MDADVGFGHLFGKVVERYRRLDFHEILEDICFSRIREDLRSTPRILLVMRGEFALEVRSTRYQR
jgi:hypothetical protein